VFLLCYFFLCSSFTLRSPSDGIDLKVFNFWHEWSEKPAAGFAMEAWYFYLNKKKI